MCVRKLERVCETRVCPSANIIIRNAFNCTLNYRKEALKKMEFSDFFILLELSRAREAVVLHCPAPKHFQQTTETLRSDTTWKLFRRAALHGSDGNSASKNTHTPQNICGGLQERPWTVTGST